MALAPGQAWAQATPRDGIWCGSTSGGGGVSFVVIGGGTRVDQGGANVVGQVFGQPTETEVGFASAVEGGRFESVSLFEGLCRIYSSAVGTFSSETTASGSASWSRGGTLLCGIGEGSEGWSATWAAPAGGGSADLSVELRAPTNPAVAGADIDFPFVIHNRGPAAAPCVKVALSTTTASTVSASLASGPLLRNGGLWAGPILPGVPLEGVVRPRAHPDAIGEVDVTAGATPVGASDPAPADNTTVARATLVSQADLEARLEGPLFITGPGLLSYLVQVGQKGPSTARSARVDVTSVPPLVPKGVFVGWDRGTSCASPCVLGDLGVGGSTVHFDFETPPGTLPSATFTLTASALSNTTDPVPGNERPSLTTTFLPDPPPSSFHTVTPCRAFDSRLSNPYPLLCTLVEVDIPAAGCGVPATATAVALNVTVTEPLWSGHLTVFPAGFPRPLTSTLNFSPFQTRATNAVLRLPPTGRIALWPQTCVHAVVDVNGYFE